MSKRWTFEQDLYLVKFFDAVGDANCARDLGKPAGSSTKRARMLKGTCAWHELAKLLAADWEFRRNYHIALGQSASVEKLDMFHPGAPEVLDERYGYFPEDAIRTPSQTGAQ